MHVKMFDQFFGYSDGGKMTTAYPWAKVYRTNAIASANTNP